MPERRSVPLSTYRLQLGPDLGFDAAAGLVDYLAALGVTHLYLSPLVAARPGSTHGYDVADPTRVSPALGGEDGLGRLAARAHAHGLGLVADIVPNHVGTGGDTPLWEALLAEGEHGPAAGFFDVDWRPPLPGAAGSVLLPVLGDDYARALSAGELGVTGAAGAYRLCYHEHSFPLSAATSAAVERAGGPASLAGVPGAPGTWRALHEVLEAQHYRLLHWRIGDALINYRRFFAVDDLAAVRVEDPAVFDHVHATVLGLVEAGVIDGLRVDHPDGLRDPARYFERLAARTGGCWTVAEKITHPAERLPDWQVAGTTGYDFANEVLALFVDPTAGEALTATDRAFAAPTRGWRELAAAAKREVAEADLLADTRRVARTLWAVARQHLQARDVDDLACIEVVVRTLAHVPVYRTYVDPETGAATAVDVARVEEAVARARADAPGRWSHGAHHPPAALFDLLADVLTGNAGVASPAHGELIARFQQLSAAVEAKGVEDTALYRWHRLVAVNEVGADPDRLGTDASTFHDACAERAARHPAAMTTTATHDTKRGEDTRLRIAALSEIAERWGRQARRWHELNRPHVVDTPDGPAPDPQTEYLLYQTLVGIWPLDGDTAALTARVQDYAVKAAREAGVRTTWTDPDQPYEAAVRAFVAAVTDPATSPSFVEGMQGLVADVAEVAMVAGLAQTVLRCTAPGVPDCYRGTELWEHTLVDPDNRGAVDFAARARLLAALDAQDSTPAQLLAARADGRIKLWVLSRALRARRAHPDAFDATGAYVPLRVEGAWREHVVAFARVGAGGSALVTVAPRLPGALMREHGFTPPTGPRWQATSVLLPADLGARRWVDVLTGDGQESEGGRLDLDACLATLPVALLTGEPAAR